MDILADGSLQSLLSLGNGSSKMFSCAKASYQLSTAMVIPSFQSTFSGNHKLGSSMSSGKNTKNYEVQVHILNQEVVANHGGPPCGVKMLPWPTKKLFESRLLLAQYDFWWQTSGSTGPNSPQCHLGNSQKFHDLVLQRNVGQKLPGRTIGSTPVSLRSTSKSTFHQAYRDDIIHYMYMHIYL